MSRKLFEIANNVAEEEGLIYAPDSAAMAWMRKFSKIITTQERERCAKLSEKMGSKKIAAAIRKGEE
jgi:hypothetical protein